MKKIMLNMSGADKGVTEKIVAAGQVPHEQVVRLQAVLRMAAGKTARETAESVRVNRANVSAIVKRYNREGLQGLIGKKTRKSRIPPVSVEIKNTVCKAPPGCHVLEHADNGEKVWSGEKVR